jgi:hypothetical protein
MVLTVCKLTCLHWFIHTCKFLPPLDHLFPPALASERQEPDLPSGETRCGKAPPIRPNPSRKESLGQFWKGHIFQCCWSIVNPSRSQKHIQHPISSANCLSEPVCLLPRRTKVVEVEMTPATNLNQPLLLEPLPIPITQICFIGSWDQDNGGRYCQELLLILLGKCIALEGS